MALLVGIIRGSAVALTASLTMSAIVFLLLPKYSARLASGRLPLLKGLLWAWSLTAVASASFSGELQRRASAASCAGAAGALARRRSRRRCWPRWDGSEVRAALRRVAVDPRRRGSRGRAGRRRD